MEKILFECTTSSPEETCAAGARLATLLEEDPSLPRFIALDGDLGTGKTEFTRGFVSVASPGSAVKSPTYAFVNEYRRGKIPVYHFDIYRIKDEDDLYSTGFYDYPENSYRLVEWASEFPGVNPERYVQVVVEKTGDGERNRRIRVSVIG